jgi:hypothetical protein
MMPGVDMFEAERAELQSAIKKHLDLRGTAPYTEQEIKDMQTGTCVFAQFLIPLLDLNLAEFVAATDADHATKKFHAIDHLIAMVLHHIGGCDSLRDLVLAFEHFRGAIIHFHMKTPPCRSTLGYANEKRTWRFFELVFNELLKSIRKICEKAGPGLAKRININAQVFSIDSTTIDLCQSMYDWALFRTTKGGIKVHLMLEHGVFLPAWLFVSNAKDHDQKILDTLDPVSGLPKGSFVCMDKAYNDFEMLHRWTTRGINFVTRAKSNMAYKVVEERPVPNPPGRPPAPGTEREPRSHVVSDQAVRLTGRKSLESYPEDLRLVTYWVQEEPGSKRHSRQMVFLTNNFKLSPLTIAQIYQSRWEIESFFKLIKQNLKLKTFLGTSANAVKIQIYSAMISLLLLKYWQALAETQWCVATMLSSIRRTLYLHRDLLKYLNRPRPETPPKKPPKPPAAKRNQRE